MRQKELKVYQIKQLTEILGGTHMNNTIQYRGYIQRFTCKCAKQRAEHQKSPIRAALISAFPRQAKKPDGVLSAKAYSYPVSQLLIRLIVSLLYHVRHWHHRPVPVCFEQEKHDHNKQKPKDSDNNHICPEFLSVFFPCFIVTKCPFQILFVKKLSVMPL